MKNENNIKELAGFVQGLLEDMAHAYSDKIHSLAFAEELVSKILPVATALSIQNTETVKNLVEVRNYLAQHKKGRMSFRPELMAHLMCDKLDAVLTSIGVKPENLLKKGE